MPARAHTVPVEPKRTLPPTCMSTVRRHHIGARTAGHAKHCRRVLILTSVCSTMARPCTGIFQLRCYRALLQPSGMHTGVACVREWRNRCLRIWRTGLGGRVAPCLPRARGPALDRRWQVPVLVWLGRARCCHVVVHGCDCVLASALCMSATMQLLQPALSLPARWRLAMHGVCERAVSAPCRMAGVRVLCASSGLC